MTKNKKQKLNRRHFYQSVIAAVLAGVLYNSWPLGYYLNPRVGAHGLASELGATGQPYNWVFIVGDVLSGLLIMLVTWLVWRTLRKRFTPLWIKLVLGSYALFGLLTCVDALLPMRCVPSLQRCPGISQDHLLLFHGVVSIAAASCLFATAFTMWRVNRAYDRYRLMWIVMLAWALFGIMSLFFFFVPGQGYLSQHYFITLCAVWMALLPVVISRTLVLEKVKI